MMSTRTLNAHCHCHLSSLSFTLSTSSLPLPVHFCHCAMCRYTHGTLFSVHAPIPTPQVDLSTFTRYQSSEYLVKRFCEGCGSHMLDCVSGGGKEEKWYVAPALVDTGVKNGVWIFTNHIFVASTRDGGLVPFLKQIEGKEMRCWNERPVDDPKFASRGNWSLSKSGTKEGRKEGEGMLEVKCQ